MSGAAVSQMIQNNNVLSCPVLTEGPSLHLPHSPEERSDQLAEMKTPVCACELQVCKGFLKNQCYKHSYLVDTATALLKGEGEIS